MRITFKRKGLHLAVSEIAYITADVSATPGDAHRLHQTYDICEGDNIHRVNSLLTLAFSEIIHTLSPLLDKEQMSASIADICSRETLSLTFLREKVRTPLLLRIKESVREYLICRVLHGWLSVTLPEAAEQWERRASLLLGSLASMSVRISTKTRKPSPF